MYLRPARPRTAWPRRVVTAIMVVPLLGLAGAGVAAADSDYDAPTPPSSSAAPPPGGDGDAGSGSTGSGSTGSGDGGDAAAGGVAPDAGSRGSDDVGAAVPPGVSGPFLGTAQTDLGTVATSDAFTVYHFLEDSTDPPTSNCNGECATAWPPVLADEEPWLKGVRPDDVGTVQRADGRQQLTLGGWPVYRYAQDTAPGDTTGHRVGGTWCAMGPTGAAVTPDNAAGAAPADTGSRGSSSAQDPDTAKPPGGQTRAEEPAPSSTTPPATGSDAAPGGY